MSRVGKKSITLPDKVTVKVNGSSVQVEGPKGKLSWTLPEGITATVEGNQLSVDRVGESRQLRALHGTNRSLLNNMVIGVSEGFVISYCRFRRNCNICYFGWWCSGK